MVSVRETSEAHCTRHRAKSRMRDAVYLGGNYGRPAADNPRSSDSRKILLVRGSESRIMSKFFVQLIILRF